MTVNKCQHLTNKFPCERWMDTMYFIAVTSAAKRKCAIIYRTFRTLFVVRNERNGTEQNRTKKQQNGIT